MGTHKLVPQIRRSGNPHRSEMACSRTALRYTFFNWLPDWILIVSFSEFHKGQLQYHSPEKRSFSVDNTYFNSQKIHITKNPLLLFIISKLLITTSLDAHMYLTRMALTLIVIFLTFLMIHRFVSFDITPLSVRGIQELSIKIEVVPYKSIYVSSILYSKDVLLEHDSTYCDTNLAINGYF